MGGERRKPKTEGHEAPAEVATRSNRNRQPPSDVHHQPEQHHTKVEDPGGGGDTKQMLQEGNATKKGVDATRCIEAFRTCLLAFYVISF